MKEEKKCALLYAVCAFYWIELHSAQVNGTNMAIANINAIFVNMFSLAHHSGRKKGANPSEGAKVKSSFRKMCFARKTFNLVHS